MFLHREKSQDNLCGKNNFQFFRVLTKKFT